MVRYALLGIAAIVLLASPAGAQSLKFEAPADAAGLDAKIPALAEAALAQYREPDERKRLDTLFRLQITAARWADAERTLAELHAHLAAAGDPQGGATDVQYQVLVRAELIEAKERIPFEAAFARAFHETMDPMDNRAAALVARAFAADQFPVGISLHAPIKETLEVTLGSVKGKSELSLSEAVALVRAWQVASAYRIFDRIAPKFVYEDDHRRYVIEEQLIAVGDGAGVCTTIVRPRNVAPLPTLLEFTIYADALTNFSEARRSASNGYVGVEGLTRGKGCSPETPVPYEHDGRDGAALIDWISKQPWSDGRVATFGASYNGFAQWAIVKYRPPALKAMMDSVSNAPAIDAPMTGSVFFRFQYPWTFYTTSNKTLDPETYGDQARWSKLFNEWYRSGDAWRALDKVDGMPNPNWDRWLEHPTYDAYWQGVVAYGDDFAHIDVPVLTTTGYFEGPGDGAVYYLGEHVRRNPSAQHYLVVGPYNHSSGNRGTIDVFGDPVDVVDGYRIDPVAHIDIGALRYQWFDYVLKDGPKPAILQDKVNYEVMGANIWHHAPSMEAMGPKRMRFHLNGSREGHGYAFRLGKQQRTLMPTLKVDLADRSDIDRTSPSSGSAVDAVLDTYESLEFTSKPFTRPVEVSGLYRANLDVLINKKDFDFEIALYELTPDGRYVQLAYDYERASLVEDRTRRILLTPGVPRRLEFQASLLMSREFQKGSRLVVLLEAIKTPVAQINYGTGKDVSDETIVDAGKPLTIQWLGDSFIDIPTAGQSTQSGLGSAEDRELSPAEPALRRDEELGRCAGAPAMYWVVPLFSSVVVHCPALDQSVAPVPQDINSHLLEWVLRTAIRPLPHSHQAPVRYDQIRINDRPEFNCIR
jgi:putative CocE/NonD family hydrolase